MIVSQPAVNPAMVPIQQPIVMLNMPSAQLLADYISVLQDLKFVQECCKHLLTVLAQPEDQKDPTLMKALWSATLIAYSRCFGTGKRFGLTTDDVRGLPLSGDVMEFHKWVRDMRDKNVAHSVNPFEQVKVGAVLSLPESPQRQVEGVGTLGMFYLMPDEAGVWQLGGLASGLADYVARKAQAQQDVVLAEARQLDVEHLYTLPDLRSTAPGPDAAGRGRSKND
jgi:hypothetical protein